LCVCDFIGSARLSFAFDSESPLKVFEMCYWLRLLCELYLKHICSARHILIHLLTV